MKKMVSVLFFIVTLVIFAADMYFGIAGSIDVKLQFAELAAKGASGHELWGVGLDVLVFGVVLLSIIGGVTALISPLAITKANLRKDIPLNIIVTALLILLGMNMTFFGIGEDSISRIDGCILLAIFVWYLWTSFKSDNNSEESTDNEGDIVTRSIPISAIMVIGGLAGLVIGGRLFVNSATSLAQMFGVSDKFIAITIMAAGTSMPELATCVVAAIKGRGQLALGNVLGSNISNILLILGGSALIHPLSFGSMTIVDLGVVVLCAIMILMSAFLFKKKELDRVEGALMLLMEAGYMWFLISNI